MCRHTQSPYPTHRRLPILEIADPKNALVTRTLVTISRGIHPGLEVVRESIVSVSNQSGFADVAVEITRGTL